MHRAPQYTTGQSPSGGRPHAAGGSPLAWLRRHRAALMLITAVCLAVVAVGLALPGT